MPLPVLRQRSGTDGVVSTVLGLVLHCESPAERKIKPPPAKTYSAAHSGQPYGGLDVINGEEKKSDKVGSNTWNLSFYLHAPDVHTRGTQAEMS